MKFWISIDVYFHDVMITGTGNVFVVCRDRLIVWRLVLLVEVEQ